jgi:hypothetical protein
MRNVLYNLLPGSQMKPLGFTVLALLMTGASVTNAEVVYSLPVGGEILTIDGGSKAAPVTSPFALTLVDRASASGNTLGLLSTVTANSVHVASAGWTAAALAHPDYPYDLQILSGAGTGARIAVIANTTDTIQVSGRDLVALGVVVGDLFQLVPVDTLDSLFGPDTFKGGSTPAEADIINLGESDRVSYFYDTTNGQWRRTDGITTNRGNTRIPPNGMVAVSRKAGAFTLALIGAVPIAQTNVPVSDQGATFTHTGFPTNISLGALAIQSRLSGWISHVEAAQADVLSVAVGASWVSYFHNGSNWQRAPGGAASRDAIIIPAGTPIRILRRGLANGSSALVLPLPYTL